MPQQKSNKSGERAADAREDRTAAEGPTRDDVQAELPQAPAHEPLAEPPPVAGKRGPGARIERERE